MVRSSGRLVFLFAAACMGATAWAGPRVTEVPPAQFRLDASATPHVARVLEVLSPVHARGRSVDDVSVALANLGPAAIPALFAVLVGNYEEPAGGPPSVDDPTRGPMPAQDQAIVNALVRLDPNKVAAHLVLAAGGAAPLEIRLVAMRVLGSGAGSGARGVDAWFAIVEGIEEIDLRRTFVREPAESALASVLGGDEKAFARLAPHLKTLKAHLAPLVTAGVSGSASARAIDVLLGLIGKYPGFDGTIIRDIGKACETAPCVLGAEQIARLVSLGASKNADLRREVAVALGRGGDHRAIPALILHLADEDVRVRDASVWSLRRLSGQNLEPVAHVWSDWFEHESAWLQEQTPALLAALEQDEPAGTTDVLRELTAHPVFRHEISAALAPLLQREDPAILICTCDLLSRIGSPRALPMLSGMLNHADEDVATAARRAVTRITGKEPRQSRAAPPASDG